MKTKRGTRRISILLVVMMILSMTPIGMTQAQAAESDGHNYANGFCIDTNADGSVCDHYQPAVDSDGDGFYEILNAGNLYWFMQQINTGNTTINGKFINDIVINEVDDDGNLYKTATNQYGNEYYAVSDSNYRPWEHVYYYEYNGILDGAGHSISGMYVRYGYDGLFTVLGDTSVIKDLVIKDSYYEGESDVNYVPDRNGLARDNYGQILNCSMVNTVFYTETGGGVCYNNYGTIDNFYFSADTILDVHDFAGICGFNYGTIKNCENNARIEGPTYAEGICGVNEGTIDNCISNFTVTSYGYVRGFTAVNKGIISNSINNSDCSNCGFTRDNYGQIINCINNGNVRGVAGIAESNFSGAVISNCVNTGTIDTYGDYAGGICFDNQGSITDCYNTGTIKSNIYIGNSYVEPQYLAGISAVNSGNISKCYNEGIITLYNTFDDSGFDEAYIGGIVGLNESTGIINNTYNIGNVSYDHVATKVVAGICATNEGTLKNSHNFAYLSTTMDYPVYQICNPLAGTSVVENCYYIVPNGTTAELDNISGTTKKTATSFANGEVTYLLNGRIEEGRGGVWFQNKEGGYPYFKVFTLCELYGHNYENGFCINELLDGTICDFYQPAEDTNNDGYYEITNGGNLYWFATQVNEKGNTTIKGKLANDIYVNTGDLTTDDGVNNENYREWILIGNDQEKEYNGTFDGANHSISGLYNPENGNLYDSALVPYIGTNGTVKNVIVKKSHFCGSSYAGAISAYNYGKIDNCTNESVIKAGASGGICGSNNGTISNSKNNGSIKSYRGTSNAGGICGVNSGKILNCTNNADILENIYALGGICGHNSGEIKSCINNGAVGDVNSTNNYSYNRVGGICGSSRGTITGCTNNGKVYGHLAGGICGDVYSSSITDSRNTADVVALGVGTARAGGICGYVTNIFDYQIKNCHNEGNVSGGNNNSELGGIIGYAYYGTTITDCSNSGSISGSNSSNVGGICGYAIEQTDQDKYYYVTIKNCNNSGTVTGKKDSYVGGICGSLYTRSIITESYNTGTIAGDSDSYIGGIAGYNLGTITISYNEGSLRGSFVNSYAGGIAGGNSGTINNTYNAGDIQSGGTWIAGICAESRGTIKNSHNYGDLNNGMSYNFEYICNPIENAVIENCYYRASDNTTSEKDYHDGTTFKTESQFASGEVTYLLNNKKSDGDLVWFQTLGTHDYPVFDGKTVYFGYKSYDEQGYSNDPLPTDRPDAEVSIIDDINLTLTRVPGSFHTYKGSITLNEGEYNFRVNEAGTIFGCKKIVYDTTNKQSLPFNYTAQATLKATGGNYTFTYNVDNNMLTISYVSNADVVSLYNPSTGADVIKLEKTSGSIYTGYYETNVPKDITFKINDNGTELGFGFTFYDTGYPEGLISDIAYSSDYKDPTTLKMSGGFYAFSYNKDTKKLTIICRLAEEEANDSIEIFGDINLKLERESSTSNFYKVSKTLNAGTYIFRIKEFNEVMCNGDTINNTTNGTLYSSEWNRPTIFNADGGTYTFRYNANSDNLTITYSPSMAQDISLVFGDTRAVLTRKGETNTYVGTVELSAGSHKFSIDEFGVRYCNGTKFKDKIQGNVYNSSWTSDTTINVSSECAGLYNIKYTTNKKQLWLTPAV